MSAPWGHRKLGRTAGNRNNKKRARGYAFLHHAIDDNTRLAYSEIHTDERKNTVIGFLRRARAFFADAGDRGAVGDDRRRAGVPLQGLRVRPGNRRPPADPFLSAADQREGGEVQPHLRRRVGLPPHLPLRRGPRSGLRRLAPLLQSPPTPHRHRAAKPPQPAFTTRSRGTRTSAPHQGHAPIALVRLLRGGALPVVQPRRSGRRRSRAATRAAWLAE